MPNNIENQNVNPASQAENTDVQNLDASAGTGEGGVKPVENPEPVEQVDQVVVENVNTNTNHQQEHINAENNGVGVASEATPTIRKFDRGMADKYIGTSDNARDNRYDMAEAVAALNVNQYDDVKLDDNSKEMAYGAIESIYSHEGTKNIDNSLQSKADKINGSLDPVVQTSHISTDTIINRTVVYGDDMPRSREIGRIFFDKGLVPFRTNHRHIVASANDDGKSPEILIQAGNQRFILFNELGKSGKFTGAYVMVQLGDFLLKGINPLPAMNFTNETISKTRIGYVERNSDSGTVRVPVYMYANHLFNVLELTATIEDIQSATHDLINATANLKNRSEIIKIQEVATSLDTLIKNSVDIKSAITDSADFIPEASRSSLYDVDRSDLPGSVLVNGTEYTQVDSSCHNDTESVIYTMDRLRSSEVMFVSILDNFNPDIVKKSMLFWKGQQGKSSHSKYFDSNMGMNFDLENVYHNFPSLLSYARVNHDVWNKESKWFGRYKNFFKGMRNELNAFLDTELGSNFLSEVEIVQDSINELMAAFEIGRVASDVKSSSDIIKRSEEAKIILGFNPNTVIGFDNTAYDATNKVGTHSCIIANPGEIKMRINNNNVSNTDYLYIPKFYPVCGYGVAAKNDNDAPDSKTYYVIPKWIQCIINALRSRDFMKDNLFHVTSSGTVNARAAGLWFIQMNNNGKISRKSGTDYLPYTWGHQTTSWLDFFLMRALNHKANADVRARSYDSTNGLDRYMKFAREVNIYASITKDDPRISLMDLYKKIKENKSLYYDPSRRDTDQFDVLKNKTWIEDPFRKPIGTLSDVKLRSTTNLSGQAAVLFAADKTERNVFDLRGFTDFKFHGGDFEDVIDDDNNPKHVFKDLTDVLWAVKNGTAKLVQIGENQYTISDSNDNIYLFKRCLDRDAQVRLELTTNGADDSVLGYVAADKAAKMFTEDKHFYSSLYDAFVLVLTKHSNMRNDCMLTRRGDSEENSISMREASEWLSYSAQICGCIYYTLPSGSRKQRIENGTRVEAAYYGTAPHILFKAHDNESGDTTVDLNILWKDANIEHRSISYVVKSYPRNMLNSDLTELTTPVEVTEKDPNNPDQTITRVVDTVANLDSVDVYESKFVSKATIPSFISGEITLFPRLVATYLDSNAKYHNGFGWGTAGFENTYYNSDSKNAVDTAEPATYRIVTSNANKNDILKLEDGMILGFPFRYEAFVPMDVVTGDTADLCYTNVEDYASKADFKRQFGYNEVDAKDRRFFDRMYYLSNDLNRIFLTNKDDFARAEDIFKFCKWAISPEIIAGNARIPYNAINVLKVRTNNKGKKTYEIDNTTNNYLDYLYDKSDIRRFEDFKYKHGIQSRLGFLPEGILLTGRVEVTGFDRKLSGLYYQDNEYEDSIMYSKNYINDFIDVRYGHCFMEDQEDWYRSREKADFFYNRNCNKSETI